MLDLDLFFKNDPFKKSSLTNENISMEYVSLFHTTLNVDVASL